MMLADTGSVRATADHGVATLWLDFPGRPVNAMNALRLAEIERAFTAVGRVPQIEALVIRSARPAGFCGGFDPLAITGLATDSDCAAFARVGQRLLDRIACAEFVTVAFLEGPCLGPGWELALACDHRFAVAGPDSWIGFPDAPPCWGSTARLGRKANLFEVGHISTAKEVLGHGLIDDAFTARRAKVELRNHLDRIVARPRKQARASTGEVNARERFAFCRAIREANPLKLPTTFPSFERNAESVVSDVLQVVELAIRGKAVATNAPELEVVQYLALALYRGRVTPLEAEQARKRITFNAATQPVPSPTSIPLTRAA